MGKTRSDFKGLPPMKFKRTDEDFSKKKFLIGFLVSAVVLILLVVWSKMAFPPVWIGSNQTNITNITQAVLNLTMPPT